VLNGVTDFREREIWESVGRTSSQNTQLQNAVRLSVLCCHLANTNEELGGLVASIPVFAKLHRFSLCRNLLQHKIKMLDRFVR